jgi:hypothetical protein
MMCWVNSWLRRLASQLGRHGRGKGFSHCLDKAGRGWPSTNQSTGSELVIRCTELALHHLTKHSSGQHHQSLCSNDVNDPIARSPQTKCPSINERAGTEWRYVRRWGRCMGSMKCPPGRHVVQDMVLHCQSFKTNKTLILKCMYHACLARYCLQVGTLCTYIYTQAILVQSS